MSTKTIKITGYCDDVVEIDGDISEEFNTCGSRRFIHFDDGTVVETSYGLDTYIDPKGETQQYGWHMEVVKLGKGAKLLKTNQEFEDGDHYRDILALEGYFKRAKIYRSEDGPSSDDIRDFFESFDAAEYGDEELKKFYQILNS